MKKINTVLLAVIEISFLLLALTDQTWLKLGLSTDNIKKEHLENNEITIHVKNYLKIKKYLTELAGVNEIGYLTNKPLVWGTRDQSAVIKYYLTQYYLSPILLSSKDEKFMLYDSQQARKYDFIAENGFNIVKKFNDNLTILKSINK